MDLKLQTEGREWQSRFTKHDLTICCLWETHRRFKHTNRLKVKGWKKIYHVNSNQKRPGIAILSSDKIDFFKKIFIYLFIYLWLCWVFVSVRGLSPVVASRGHSSSRYVGLPPSRPLLLRSTGSRCAGSVIVAHGPSRSAACGILPDQGSNPCPLHRQADSQPLRHQGSPQNRLLDKNCYQRQRREFYNDKRVNP